MAKLTQGLVDIIFSICCSRQGCLFAGTPLYIVQVFIRGEFKFTQTILLRGHSHATLQINRNTYILNS